MTAVAAAGCVLPDGEIRCLLQETGGGLRKAATTVEQARETDKRAGVFCRRCRCRITDDEHRIEVDGAHTHAFFNPAGILFEVACFRLAPGCVLHGEASGQFTWFAGYLWRVALCGHCSSHLGWRFTGQDPSFFCLILSSLTKHGS